MPVFRLIGEALGAVVGVVLSVGAIFQAVYWEFENWLSRRGR